MRLISEEHTEKRYNVRVQNTRILNTSSVGILLWYSQLKYSSINNRFDIISNIPQLFV